MSTDRERSQGRVHAALEGFARALVAHPKLVIGWWLLVVALSTPLALQASSVLSTQGSSKVVPGSESAAVAADIDRDFPAHSEGETLVVLDHFDERSARMRQLLAALDGAIGRLEAQGTVIGSVSAYTLRRDAVLDVVDRTLAAAAPSLADVGPTERRVRLTGIVRRSGLAPRLQELVLTADAAPATARATLAGDVVTSTDWTRFPVPVVTRDVVSPDGRTALVVVSFRPGTGDPDIVGLRAMTSRVVASLGLEDTVAVHVTGEIPLLQDTYRRAEADNARMEQVAYVVIAIVLLLFFRAVLPALITVATIGLASNVSQAWLTLIGRHVHLTQFTTTIMTFVILGAGIDYSMLLSSRYRQERLTGASVEEAVVRATVRAGESVLLAGTAVVLSFGATLVSPIDWIPPLGYGGLVGIPIILAAALTITPCLLILLGDRFFLLGLRPLSDLETSSALARALRSLVTATRACPLAVVAAFVAVTVPFAVVVAGHGLSADPLALSPTTDAKAGAQVVAHQWGQGTLFPTVVTGRLPASLVRSGTLTTEGRARLATVGAALAAQPGVARVATTTSPFGTDLPSPRTGEQPAALTRDFLAPDGTTRIAVTLRGDPFSIEARETVDRIGGVLDTHGLATLRVGGATRVDAQYNEALHTSFLRMIGLVASGVFVLLLFALRSVLIPVRLILTILMSNLWAVGVTVLVFQTWLGQPVIDDLPVFLVILMMGLGMDYEIFLITRVRDLVRHGHDDADATSIAVVDTGRVITAAGLVMAGSLGTMALSSTLMLREYGVGLGTAVLLDATLVRMLFVPASLMLLQRYNWWVPRLGRRTAAQS
ncbi:MMPL [Nostocoides japonicum T1-X7]|uniref:MMPL n=1 Tax=Nostocoides japonicum T1-X7 TaxID=1194083 RepID=A0A077LSX3_9MICO|nr:MMPL family transporter [Tetrasphaera japonica]CCH76343.1 MMPL [Tetrasphaera japonica T1-X7]